jgi:hypothetical protein
VVSYGFKLIEIQLFHGRGRTALDFGAPDGKNARPVVHYLDRLMADFGAPARADDSDRVEVENSGGEVPDQTGAGEGEQVEEVSMHSDDVVGEDSDEGVPVEEGRKQLAVVRVQNATRYRSAVLLDTVYGIVGDHSLAVDPEGREKDTDLTKLATTRHYRALVIAPDEGKNGFLAVEVVSRSHPAGRLPSRLLTGARGHNLKIRTFGAVADEVSVKNLMDDARIREVTLTQTVPSGDSARPSTIKAKLTFSIGAGSIEEETLRKRFRGWVPTRANKAKKKKPTAKQEARELASYLWPKLAKSVKFDEVEALIEGTHRKRLRPLDMAEGFTYDIGDVVPSDDDFVRHIADVVDTLSATHQINLDDNWADRLEKDESADS